MGSTTLRAIGPAIEKNNQAAVRFVAESVRGAGYGYILTTSSQDEAKELARLK